MHITEDELIDHLLGNAEPETVAHVAACSACRSDAEELHAMLELTRDVPPPPDGLSERVWQAVGPRLAPRPAPFWARPRFLATAATVAIAVIAGLLAWQHEQAPIAFPTRVPPQIARKRPITVTTPPATTTTTMKVVTSTAPIHKPAPPPRRQTPEKVHEVVVHLWPGVLRPRADGDAVERELAAGGDEYRLGQIALNDDRPEVRLEAIDALKILQTPEAEAQLVAIYPTESDPKARRAIIAAIVWQKNAESLEQLASNETDPALKKNILSVAERIRRSQAPEQLTHNPRP
jgi:hypothetical protein